MKNTWLVKFTAISTASIILIVHLIIVSIWSGSEKNNMRDKARQQAISSNETLSNLLIKEQSNLDTLLGVGSIKDKGRVLSLTSNYEAGYLFSLRSLDIVTLFGNELDNQISYKLRQELRSKWNRGKNPFNSINYIRLNNRVYSLKYVIDFHEKENYILVLNLKDSVFNQIIASFKDGFKREMMIFNSTNELITSTVNARPPKNFLNSYHENNFYNDFEVYMINEKLGWKVFLSYPDIYEGVFLNMFKKAFLITLPFGVFLMWILHMFALKFYKPLRNLITFFEEHIEEDPEKEISQLLNIKSSYEKYLPHLREQNILRFVKKNKAEKDFIEELSSEFKGFYILLIIPTKLILDDRLKEVLDHWEKDLELLRDEKNIILIFNSSKNEELIYLRESFGFVHNSVISFSNIYSDITLLNQAYKEGIFGIYSSIKFNSNIITPDMIKEPSNNVTFLDDEQKNFLKNLRVSDNLEDNLRELLNKIFSQDLSVINLKFSLTKLLTDIYNFSIEKGVSKEELSLENLYFELDHLKSRSKAETFFIKLISNLKNSLESIQLEEDKKIIRDIEAYIEANYLKVSFTISDISEEIKYSISHIERKFKSFHAISLKSYVITKRLSYAKGILKSDSTIKIKDLAYNCGYDNSKSFTNIFKKYEGLTPAEYRKK